MHTPNPTSVSDISSVMIAAVEAAGFTNPAIELFTHDGETGVCVSGDCPCGLGTSRFAILFDAKPDPSQVYGAILHQAQEHIELDRAEGRWSPL